MRIETKRMIIRDFEEDDALDLQEILGDAETMEYCEPPYSLPQTSNFLSAFCIDKKGAVAAVHREKNKVIGYILFHQLNAGVYEIGWFFNRKYWRQGFAYEACSKVFDYAFDQQNGHKLIAETIDPVKSVGMMKKLGMVPEGKQRCHTKDNHGNWADLYLYGMLREDRHT